MKQLIKKDAENPMQKGHFDLNDMAKQLEQMVKMVVYQGLMKFLYR